MKRPVKLIIISLLFATVISPVCAQLLLLGAGADYTPPPVSSGAVLQTDAASFILLVGGGKLLKAN